MRGEGGSWPAAPMIDAGPSSVTETPHSKRRRWPWIALLVASGAFWMMGFAGLTLSPERVPTVVPVVLSIGWPYWLLGLGRGRWPSQAMMALGCVAFGVFAVGLASVMIVITVGGRGEIRHVPPQTIEGRTVRLVYYDVKRAGSCSDVYTELAGGWLWQTFDLTWCLDDYGVGPFVPSSLAVEIGPIPDMVAITADVTASNVDTRTAVVRKQLGVYHIGFGGLMIGVPAVR